MATVIGNEILVNLDSTLAPTPTFRDCLHGGGGLQIGEVTCGSYPSIVFIALHYHCYDLFVFVFVFVFFYVKAFAIL